MMSKFFRNGLMALGIASVSLSGVMLSKPAQAQVVVEVDGELDEYGVYTAPILSYGDTGPIVRDVQEFLDEEGLYDGPIDGFYGLRTQAAVREFQEDDDLLANGIIGPNTWARMMEED